MALAIGDKKEIVFWYPQGTYPRCKVLIVCFGSKRHYRKDGSCKHTQALVEQLRPGYRQRVELHGFGGA